MKEARHKRLHIVWFHLYEVSGIGKYTQTENRLVLPGTKGELEEGGGRNQRGDAEPGPWGWAGAGRTKGQS